MRPIFLWGAAMLGFVTTAEATAAEPKPDARPELEIRILFDNSSARDDLQRSWGFSALIDFRGRRLLFDAGCDPILLLEHLDKLHIDPKSIEQAVISHHHDDHRRGVYWVFEKNPALKVHFLDCFPDEAFREAATVQMKPNRVKEPFEVVPGIFSTGVIEGLPSEQALIIETSQGPVMLVGCSHPGIIKMVETAQRQRKKDSIRLLLGGLHLLRTPPEEIRKTVNRLQELKVAAVMPAHCTGDLATEMLLSAYGKHLAAGVGRQIVLDRDRLEIRTLPKK
jgi:7,8-dihydropterin-6-yl-methyl-4-(beta-D-ribofuranosyl)aminobenzene 5'-phosphate synthase